MILPRRKVRHEGQFADKKTRQLSDEIEDRDKTYIIPFDNYPGCVIAFSAMRYFPYAPYCDVRDRGGHAKEIQRFDYAYMHGDNSLIAVLSGSNRKWPETTRIIKKLPLNFNPSSISLGKGGKWTKFKSLGEVHGARVVIQPKRFGVILVYDQGQWLRGFWNNIDDS